MDLHGQVLAPAEGAPGAGEGEPHLLPGQVEAGGDLVAVDVQPLGRHEQLDPAVLARHGQPRLRAEEGLVLHAHLVRALDDHVAGRFRIAVPQPDVPEHVAVGVDGRRRDRRLCVHQRFEHLVLDLDGRAGAGGELRVVGGHRGDGLAVEAHHAVREHGLVVVFQAVRTGSPQVVLRHDGVYPGHGQCTGDVDPDDARGGVRAAEGLAPGHAVDVEVGGERELAPDLGRRVGTQQALAEARRTAPAGEGGRHARRGHVHAPPEPGGTPRRCGRSRCSGTGCPRSPRASPARSLRGCGRAGR